MFRVGFWQGAAKSIETGADFPQVEAQLDRILARLEPAVLDNMSPLIEAYAHVYAREFSDAELEQMIAFAQSPAGKHYLQDFPRLESDPMMTDAAMELIDELSPLLEDVQKELCADAAAQRIAAGDTDARCPLSAPDIAAG